MKDQTFEPDTTEQTGGSLSSSVKQNGKKRAARRGGWQSTKRLAWDEVREISGIARAARRARQPLNVLATIRAPIGVPDAVGKRIISKKVGHFGEALKRRRQEHVGVTVYEKDPHLHAHHLAFVDPENDDVIARFHDGEEVHARPAVPTDVGYITKQRDWLGPEIEKKKRLPWQRGAPIPGPRWAATKAARALAEPPAKTTVAKVQITAVDGTPAMVSQAAVDALQLSLFSILPCVIPFGQGTEIRQARERTGITQEALAARLGLRDRSHIANVERGHDRLSPQRCRLLRHFVETTQRAAA